MACSSSSHSALAFGWQLCSASAKAPNKPKRNRMLPSGPSTNSAQVSALMSQTPRHLWRIVEGDPCAAKVSKTSSERHGNKFSDWFSVLASSPATTRASCRSLAALVSSRMQEAIKSSAASKSWPSTHTSARHRPSDEPSARGFSLTSSSPLATFATVQMHRPYPDTSHTSRRPWLASCSLAERALIHWWTCSRVQEKQQVAKKFPPIHSFEYVRRKKNKCCRAVARSLRKGYPSVFVHYECVPERFCYLWPMPREKTTKKQTFGNSACLSLDLRWPLAFPTSM